MARHRRGGRGGGAHIRGMAATAYRSGGSRAHAEPMVGKKQRGLRGRSMHVRKIGSGRS